MNISIVAIIYQDDILFSSGIMNDGSIIQAQVDDVFGEDELDKIVNSGGNYNYIDSIIDFPSMNVSELKSSIDSLKIDGLEVKTISTEISDKIFK